MLKEISMKRLAELLRAEYKLDLLEGGGVDNWEGYDESLNYKYEDEESYFDFSSKSDEEITSEFKDIR
jgi:hypothetical protein